MKYLQQYIRSILQEVYELSDKDREFGRHILLEQTGNIQTDLIAKYGVDLRIYEEPELITLSKIIVPDTMRGQGIGSKVMLDLTDYADLKGKIIATTPSEDFGGNKSRLLKFYRSFDFIPNKGRKKVWETMETMIRIPR